MANELDQALARFHQEILAPEFNRIDERFTKQDERFTKQDERFAKQDERFTKQDERFAKQDERFDRLVGDTLMPLIERVDRRFDILESRIDTMHQEMLSHFDAIYARFDRLEVEYQMLSAGAAARGADEPD